MWESAKNVNGSRNQPEIIRSRQNFIRTKAPGLVTRTDGLPLFSNCDKRLEITQTMRHFSTFGHVDPLAEFLV